MKYRFTKTQINMILNGKSLKMNCVSVLVNKSTRDKLRSLVVEYGIDKITVIWDSSSSLLDVEIAE
jgi:hypothetical protein